MKVRRESGQTLNGHISERIGPFVEMMNDIGDNKIGDDINLTIRVVSEDWEDF